MGFQCIINNIHIAIVYWLHVHFILFTLVYIGDVVAVLICVNKESQYFNCINTASAVSWTCGTSWVFIEVYQLLEACYIRQFMYYLVSSSIGKYFLVLFDWNQVNEIVDCRYNN